MKHDRSRHMPGRRSRALIVAAVLGALVSPGLAGEPPRPCATKSKAKPSEFAEMLAAILVHGADMAPGSGWFHPSEGRHDWNWLAARFDANHDDAVTVDELKGHARLFRALDRDGDGTVTREDLDWSPRSRYLQRRAQSRGHFARIDQNGNGRIVRAEWEKAFEKAANGKTYLSQDDLADLFYPSAPSPESAANGKKPAAPAGPSRLTLLKGLFSGEIGSATEGPKVGEEAPAFTLKTHDQSRRISLADYRGKKPVVLIFGSFT